MKPVLQWPKLSEAVVRLLGLHFSSERTPDLHRGLQAAANEAGIALEAFADKLLAGTLDATETNVLAGQLTIGETYFLRAPEFVDVLREHVLPQLIASRRESRRLRLWSAGCCTGEEPYTLAMLLRELLPDIGAWQISLLATDVNPRFLHKAGQGLYGEWSFRATPDHVKRRYFQRLDDGRYAIHDSLRSMVTFLPLNLNEDVYPSIATGTNAMDLVLCRNVLMYFEPAQARRAIGRLRASLRDDGWLSVAPCETSHALFADFEAVAWSGTIVYRMRDASKRSHESAAIPTQPEERGELIPAPVRRAAASGTGSHRFGRRVPAPVHVEKRTACPSPPASPPDIATPHPLGYRAKALADQGRLDEAVDTCDQWIAEQKLEIAAHYLRALITMELGEIGEAAASLRRCAYLAPDEPMINFSMGNLERRRGQHGAALGFYRHALAVMSNLESGAAIAFSDGLTAGQLTSLTRKLIATERLDERAA